MEEGWIIQPINCGCWIIGVQVLTTLNFQTTKMRWIYLHEIKTAIWPVRFLLHEISQWMHQSANRKELDANSNRKIEIAWPSSTFLSSKELLPPYSSLHRIFHLILTSEQNIWNLVSYPIYFLTDVWIIRIKTSRYQQFAKVNNPTLQQNFALNQHIRLIPVVVETIVYCQWRNKTYQCDVRCLARNQLTVHVALLSMTSYFMLSSRWSGCYTTTQHPTSIPRSFNFLPIPYETLQPYNLNNFTLPRQPSNLAHPASLMFQLPSRLSNSICE